MPKNELFVLLGEFINERIGTIEEADKDNVTPFITKVSKSGEALQATLSTEQQKLWNAFDNDYDLLISEMILFWYKSGFKDGLNIDKLIGENLEN